MWLHIQLVALGQEPTCRSVILYVVISNELHHQLGKAPLTGAQRHHTDIK